MDHVQVQNLCIFGRHGVLEEERRLGQKFYVDLDVALDSRAFTRDDSYENAVCYAGLCELVQRVSSAETLNLIESLGDRIAVAILKENTQVSEACVTIRKPSAPINASLDTVSVVITRNRGDLD